MTITTAELLELHAKHRDSIVWLNAKFDFDTKTLLNVTAYLVLNGVHFMHVAVELPETKEEKRELLYTFLSGYRECSREEMPADGVLQYFNFDAWLVHC